MALLLQSCILCALWRSCFAASVYNSSLGGELDGADALCARCALDADALLPSIRACE